MSDDTALAVTNPDRTPTAREQLVKWAREVPLDTHAELTPSELDAWGRGYFAGWHQGYQDGLTL